MPEPEFLHDGNYSRPVPVGARRFEYPFRHNGDRVSALFEEDYWQAAATFHPMEFTTPHPDLRDFYLVGESQPVEFMAGLVRFTRLYSRVPKQQVVPSSMFVTKPLLSGTFPLNIGGSTVIQPDEGVGTFQFYSMTAVTFDTGTPFVAGAANGNVQLICGPNSCVINVDDSAANVQAAMNSMGILSSRLGLNVTKESATQYIAHLDSNIYFPGLTYLGGDGSNYMNVANMVHNGPPQLPGAWAQQFLPNYQLSGLDRLHLRYTTGNGANAFTGGNFQLSFGGLPSNTLANYDATHAEMAAVLAAHPYGAGLSYIVPATLFPGPRVLEAPSNTTIQFGIRYILPPITGNTANLFPPGGIFYANAINTNAYRITIEAGSYTERIIVSGVHGISNSDTIILRAGSNYEAINSGNFTVINSTAVGLNSAAGNGFTFNGIWTAIGRLGSTYSGGGVSVLTRIRKQTDFYLPGITPGISSADDVPLPVYQGSDSELVQAILGGSTQINYEVGELTQWRETPILARTTITINPNTI